MQMIETFGWGKEEFLRTNLNALSVSGFDWRVKRQLEARLRAGYAD
jgi:hypothetical protein